MTKKPITFFIVVSFLTAVSVQPAFSGINLLTNPDFETGATTGWSPFGCTLSTAAISHSGNYSCLASDRSGAWSGPSQILLGSINDGETCSISGWVRLQNVSSADVKATIQQIDASGTKYHLIGSQTVHDDNWTNISGFFTLDVNDTLSQLRLYFEGPDPNVNFYLDDASVVVASSGDWKTEANDRIEQIRKGDFRITIVASDDPNLAIPDVNVQVIQTRHQFAFGSMMNWQQMDNSPYLDFFNDHFEWAVMGNASKWYHNEASEGYVTYTDADKIYNFCEKNGIPMRGHCIFWASDDMVQDWVKALSYASLPAASDLRTAVENRLDSAANHFKGKFLHWDINNEMCNNTFFADRLGYDIRPWMFQVAHAIDPNCKLFLNDYNVINGGYNLNIFKQIVYDLANEGAPIHGLGVQCHMTTGFNPATIKARFDSIAEVNLPIWVTEFDVSQPDENIRADELEDFYRVAFSHPAVEGILMWGFWQDQRWRENCYIVNCDWTLNAAGVRYEALMDEWTTNDFGVTNSNGNADFRGFYGTYEVTITPVDGNSEVHNIELVDSVGTNQFTLQIGTGTPPDHNAPVLEPFTWLLPPQAVAAGTVSVTAVEANDISGVEYYFNNVTDPNHDSGWQDNNFYADVGLTPNTNYTYRFKVRDKSTKQNETSFSDAATVRTLASGGNILTNAGFEAATIIGWTKWTGDLIAVTGQAHSGSYSALAATRGQTWQGPVQDITEKVINGKTYQCSAWVRLDNSASDIVLMTIKQIDDGGTHYYSIDSGTAYNNQWVYLDGIFPLDVNGTLQTLNIYLSGPAPDVNFYVDDIVVKTDPIDCLDVQQFGFGLAPDMTGDCYTDYLDLMVLVDQWLSTNPIAVPPNYSPDIYSDDEVNMRDFTNLAAQWLYCNNPSDDNCTYNWQN